MTETAPVGSIEEERIVELARRVGSPDGSSHGLAVVAVPIETEWLPPEFPVGDPIRADAPREERSIGDQYRNRGRRINKWERESSVSEGDDGERVVYFVLPAVIVALVGRAGRPPTAAPLSVLASQ